MTSETMNELFAAGEAAEMPIYGNDFLYRTLAIVYCYGGGPGGEYFCGRVGHAVAMKAGAMFEEAIRQKNWKIVRKFQSYVRELQTDNAPWLEMTLDKLNIPVQAIKFCECV